MSGDQYRRVNRLAISTALLTWLLVHGLTFLGPPGETAGTTRLLAMGGLVLMLPLIAWPWLRRRLTQSDDGARSDQGVSDSRISTLVCIEIVVLSAVSMLLLTLIPS